MSLTIPHVFYPGQKALSQEVNTNFAYLKDAIYQNVVDINSLSNSISTTSSSLTLNIGDLTSLSTDTNASLVEAINEINLKPNPISLSICESKTQNSETAPSSEIIITKGENASIDKSDIIKLDSEITKNITYNFNESTGGFIPFESKNSVESNETYHLILFKGKVDSDSDYNEANAGFIHYSAFQGEFLSDEGLQALETASGLIEVKYRRIKSEVTDENAEIIPSVQFGDIIKWKFDTYQYGMPDIEYAQGSISTTLVELSTPKGIITRPILLARIGNYAGSNLEVSLYDLNTNTQNYYCSFSSGYVGFATDISESIFTNKSSQIGYSISGWDNGDSVSLYTQGYIDTRGK